MSPEIREFLINAGAAFKVHGYSLDDANAALPFDHAARVKGLAFRLPDGTYTIIGMQANCRADYKKIADALGIRRAALKAADASDLVRDLHMPPGGVAPLPINGAVVLFDRQVLDLDVVFCGAGRTDAILEIARPDLVRIAGGRLADVAKPRTSGE
jgi:Cys-tRNA(Pro)/Cys-tRNA(Cys) deacylase